MQELANSWLNYHVFTMGDSRISVGGLMVALVFVVGI